MTGIEPVLEPWQGPRLPLHHIRIVTQALSATSICRKGITLFEDYVYVMQEQVPQPCCDGVREDIDNAPLNGIAERGRHGAVDSDLFRPDRDGGGICGIVLHGVSISEGTGAWKDHGWILVAPLD
jgi:hypothetical protein